MPPYGKNLDLLRLAGQPLSRSNSVTFLRNKLFSHSAATRNVIVTLVRDRSASELEWLTVQTAASVEAYVQISALLFTAVCLGTYYP